ncbi:triose-phosphate isomerase [uncultured Mucilaginibacter sp.]|uniref:triose-phosphate isomerase n=1 Tax=uncultured Mucilaginibacter sp. TaxID=797541 RepID=UPI002619A777|nr:triose-phosphate isomerase [uncultured Mucilaginibacter sp.]
MRQKTVAGNWKMNLDYQEGLALFSEVINRVKAEVTGIQQVIICCPFIHLHALVQLAQGFEKTAVGAQNIHQSESGAHTGEVSAKMVRSVGAAYVIVGHSERRQEFGEGNVLLAEKIDIALKNNLKPIFCMGETIKEREAGKHFDVISQQLTESVFHLNEAQIDKLILAYEPVWSIGTGITASTEQAQEMHFFIRNQIAAEYGQAAADRISILYGGSVNPENAADIFAKPDIDGGLIGGASLKSRDFVAIVNVFNRS